MQAEIDELKAIVEAEFAFREHRPPSSDGFNKPKPAFSKKKKRSGGQFGHRGNTLKRVENPDVVVDCEPPECFCGKTEWTAEVEIVEARQVFDVPEPRLEVVEYRRVKRKCRCGATSCGGFSAKITASVQ